MLGTFHVIDGIVALTKSDYYLVDQLAPGDRRQHTTWGWVHILGGILIFAAGAGVLAGQVWARVVGTAVAVVSAVVDLVFLAAYPIWSLMMIGLAVVVIMALTGPRLRDQGRRIDGGGTRARRLRAPGVLRRPADRPRGAGGRRPRGPRHHRAVRRLGGRADRRGRGLRPGPRRVRRPGSATSRDWPRRGPGCSDDDVAKAAKALSPDAGGAAGVRETSAIPFVAAAGRPAGRRGWGQDSGAGRDGRPRRPRGGRHPRRDDEGTTCQQSCEESPGPR